MAQDSDQRFAADEYEDHAEAAFETYQADVKKGGGDLNPGSRVRIKHMGARTTPGAGKSRAAEGPRGA